MITGHEPGHRRATRSSLPLAGLSALGIVFGDIGTSPLYTLKTVLALTGENPDTAAILGALSLVIWTLGYDRPLIVSANQGRLVAAARNASSFVG